MKRPFPLLSLLLVIASLLVLATGCRTGRGRAAQSAAKQTVPLTQNQAARRVLCSDVGEDVCLSTCSDDSAPREHAECLIDLRFQSDPEALELARALYASTNTLVGVEARSSIDGYRGEQHVELYPALPLGEQRHHLEWLSASMASFEEFVESLRAHARSPVAFTLRPRAFMFFRTAGTSYPSAYCWEGSIAYNLEGPLHTNARDVHETLFHELFHLNDAERGAWSATALGPLFEAIVARCGTDHDCFTPFAPHGTVVPEGTYYAFDARTRDVREYGAELALRYFLEHEVILAGESPPPPLFKCLTDENRIAWERLAEAFFGGVDLTPLCDG